MKGAAHIRITHIDDDYRAYQRIVGGLFCCTDIPAMEATIYSNDDGLLIGLPYNERATVLLWQGAPHLVGHNILVGDVVVTGLPDDEGRGTSVPSRIIDWAKDWSNHDSDE